MTLAITGAQPDQKFSRNIIMERGLVPILFLFAGPRVSLISLFLRTCYIFIHVKVLIGTKTKFSLLESLLFNFLVC